MDERTQRLVQDLLAKAHERAYASVGPELEGLPPEERCAVLGSIDALRSCVIRQLEGALQIGEAQERISALIHGHQAPSSVRAMEVYARLLVDLLAVSRDELTTVRRRWDH